MKSLMLELIDVLQRLERAVSQCEDAHLPTPPSATATDSERYRDRELRRIASEAAKSLVLNPEEADAKKQDSCSLLEQEAEALRDIITTFGERHGVGLIDEVDMILHPLKSELNFPIGIEHKAELSPERWELPMFMLEAIFFEKCNAMSLADGPKLTKDGVGSRGHLNVLVRQLQQGVRQQLLLDQPHLVLLHRDFYEAHLKEPLARWTLYFFVPWLIAEVESYFRTLT